MRDAPDFVVREQAGLDRFADVMRADGSDRDRVLALPNEQNGYWYAQAKVLAWKAYVAGGTALHMLASKPGGEVTAVRERAHAAA